MIILLLDWLVTYYVYVHMISKQLYALPERIRHDLTKLLLIRCRYQGTSIPTTLCRQQQSQNYKSASHEPSHNSRPFAPNTAEIP